MSETIVQTVQPDALVDIFGPKAGAGTGEEKLPGVKFGSSDPNVADIFSQSSAATETTTVSSSATDTTTSSSSSETTTIVENPDILGQAADPKKTTTPISDLSAYYEERIKNGTFVAIEEVDEKGNKVPFIPKTAEEYDEVLKLQIDYQLDKAKKEMEKSWYEGKSPAWKAVSQYAEIIDDPSQLIPFLQGVKVITSVANLDENNIEGAEKIIRTRMLQTGEPEELINQQIEVLKKTDTLLATAKQYKPIIIKQEQAALAADAHEKELQNKQWEKMVSDIRDNALRTIEQPLFGKVKLKQEEKAAIYDLIAEPSDTTQGYGIYTVIDNLYDKKDFEMLRLVSLLITNKDAFFNYLGVNVANQTAASLEKKLRLAGDSHKASGKDFDEEQRATIVRNQFNKKPTFGR